jgi:hypothetical protein
VLVVPFGATTLRAVTHLDVDRGDVERAAEILAEVLGASGGRKPVAPVKRAAPRGKKR